MTGNLDVQKRLTLGEDALATSGEEGQLRYNPTTNDFEGHNGNVWKSLTKSGSPTGSGMVTDIDGNQYLTVTIGTQTWMRENLRTSRYSNGDPILEVLLNDDWEALSSGAWSWYDHDPEKDKPYGKLYNFYAVQNAKGLCPTGWHVPSDAEYTTLTNALGGTAVAGGKMKTTGTIQAETGYWEDPNTGSTNESGFTGLPGGVRNFDGLFGVLGREAYWWTSTPTDNGTESWYRRLLSNDASVTRATNIYNHGLSVRCVRD